MIFALHTSDNVTTALQKALLDAVAAGEGLELAAGDYKVCSLTLPSGTRLTFAPGARLLADGDEAAWTEEYNHRAILTAQGATDIAIDGPGVIDGGGMYYRRYTDAPSPGDHPSSVLYFAGCTGLTVTGLRLQYAVGWTLHLNDCEQVTVRDMEIYNPPWTVNRCTDGIDLNGCRHVLVEDCRIVTGDDAVCLKNIGAYGRTEPRAAMHDITVRRCALATTCNAVKVGTETVGDIYDVHFEDITIRPHPDVDPDAPYVPLKVMSCPIAAISLQSNDGSHVHGITFRRITAEKVLCPLLIMLQNRKTKDPNAVMGTMEDILVEDLTVKKCLRNAFLNAQTPAMIRDVTLRRVDVTTYEPTPAETHPMHDRVIYPDIFQLPPFAAYGMYVRHVEGLKTEDVAWHDAIGSGRPTVLIEE